MEKAQKIKEVFGSDSGTESDSTESQSGVRKSSRIKSILKKRKKDEFLEGAEETDFYPMTKLDANTTEENVNLGDSNIEHSSCFEDSVENRTLKWLLHHEKLLDLSKWVYKLSNGKKDISGWRYEVCYKQKEGDKKYRLLDACFISNKNKKMRTRREVAYYLNLNLNNRIELSRAEVFKYAFQKNLARMKIHTFPAYKKDQIALSKCEPSLTFDDCTTVSEGSDLENFEMQFLSNEDLHDILAIEDAGIKKLEADALYSKEKSGTKFKLELINAGNDQDGYYRYFLNSSSNFLNNKEYVKFDLQGKPVRGCDVTLKKDLVFDDTVIISLGHVLNEKAFHGEEFIYPAGFTSKCKFLSRKTFIDEVFYTCQIRENLDKCWKNGGRKKKAGPVFIVTDDIGNVFKGSSPQQVWTQVIVSFMKAFNEKCRRIATISELLYSNKKSNKPISNEETVKRKVRHIITGVVTRICNKHLKLEQTGEDTFDEFIINKEDFERTRTSAIYSTEQNVESDDEENEAWWSCNVEYTLRGDLGNYLFGLDRLEVRCIVEGLPGVSTCCPRYIFIVQRESYKKSFNVKATKKIASNSSRLQRGFSKIRKHLESVEKRAEVANKRFMRLEDDIKKRKAEKDTEDDTYKSFMQLINKKIDSSEKKSEKKLSPKEKEQAQALEKTKVMVTAISFLSKNIGDLSSGKFLANLPEKDSKVEKMDDYESFLQTLRTIGKKLSFFGSYLENSLFLSIYFYVNFFGETLGIFKRKVLSSAILDNQPDKVEEEMKEELKVNSDLNLCEDSQLLEYRRSQIAERDNFFKRKKRTKSQKADASVKENDLKKDICSGKSVKVENSERVEESNAALSDEDEDEENELDKKLEKPGNVKKEASVSNAVSKPSKLTIVESMAERPPIFMDELHSFFVGHNRVFFTKTLCEVVKYICKDYKNLISNKIQPKDDTTSHWDEENILFRRIPINEYTLEECIRLILVLCLPQKQRIVLQDGTGVSSDNDDFLDYASLAYSNFHEPHVHIQQVKAKNFNISGRRSSKSKSLTERQQIELEKINRFFDIRSHISKAVDSRILQLQIPEFGNIGSKVKQVKARNNLARYDAEYTFLQDMTDNEINSLPCWLYKLFEVRSVKETRLLRMKKIVSEANVLLVPSNEVERDIKNKLLELIISSPVDMKREVFDLIETFVDTEGIVNSGLSLEDKQAAEIVLRILSNIPLCAAFCTPVDSVLFPDYEEKIDQPIDLQTMHMMLSGNSYENIEEFLIHGRLVWKNCFKYNPKKSEIFAAAQKLSNIFEGLVHNVIFVSNRQGDVRKAKEYLKLLRSELGDIEFEETLLDDAAAFSNRIPYLWDLEAKPDFVRIVKTVKPVPKVVPRKIISATRDERRKDNSIDKQTTTGEAKKFDVLLHVENCDLRAEDRYLGYIVRKSNVTDTDTIQIGICERYINGFYTVVFPKSRHRESIPADKIQEYIRNDVSLNDAQSFEECFHIENLENLLDIRKRLLFQSIEEFSTKDKLVLLKYLFDLSGESTQLREEIDFRLATIIQMRKRWRLNPPMVKRRFKNQRAGIENTKPWFQKYPGPGIIDNLTDEASRQISQINDELWALVHDKKVVLNRPLESAYNRVERELARCHKKKKKKFEEKLWKVEMDALLQRFHTRLQLIGRDRCSNRYYAFPNDTTKVLVHTVSSKSTSSQKNNDEWIVFSGRSEIDELVNILSSKTKSEGRLSFNLCQRLPLIVKNTEQNLEGEDEAYAKSSILLAINKQSAEAATKVGDAFVDLLWNCKSSHLLNVENVEEHIDIVKKALSKIGFTRSTRQGKIMFTCKVVMLNIEKIFYEARKLKGNLRGWFDGKRLGWMNFVLKAATCEDMAQGLFFLEEKLERERIEMSEWYETCYGDCSLAIRCLSFSSLSCRIFALDECLNYISLGKKKFRKRNTASHMNKRRRVK